MNTKRNLEGEAPRCQTKTRPFSRSGVASDFRVDDHNVVSYGVTLKTGPSKDKVLRMRASVLRASEDRGGHESPDEVEVIEEKTQRSLKCPLR